jgi:hypothetical protein
MALAQLVPPFELIFNQLDILAVSVLKTVRDKLQHVMEETQADELIAAGQIYDYMPG